MTTCHWSSTWSHIFFGEVFMVQSGIAYAAGQLLAVVAPRTVLVVDAPTDWSLAGPLWELALDDAAG